VSIVVDICSHPSGARNLYTADRIDFLKLCDGAWVWGIYCCSGVIPRGVGAGIMAVVVQQLNTTLFVTTQT